MSISTKAEAIKIPQQQADLQYASTPPQIVRWTQCLD